MAQKKAASIWKRKRRRKRRKPRSNDSSASDDPSDEEYVAGLEEEPESSSDSYSLTASKDVSAESGDGASFAEEDEVEYLESEESEEFCGSRRRIKRSARRNQDSTVPVELGLPSKRRNRSVTLPKEENGEDVESGDAGACSEENDLESEEFRCGMRRKRRIKRRESRNGINLNLTGIPEELGLPPKRKTRAGKEEDADASKEAFIELGNSSCSEDEDLELEDEYFGGRRRIVKRLKWDRRRLGVSVVPEELELPPKRRTRPVASLKEDGEFDNEDDEDFVPEEEELIESPIHKRQKRERKWCKPRKRKNRIRVSDDEDNSVDSDSSDEDFTIGEGKLENPRSPDERDEADKGPIKCSIPKRKTRWKKPSKRRKRKSPSIMISDDKAKSLDSDFSGKNFKIKGKSLKGKGVEIKDSANQVCGVCLSEEKKETVRGLLDSCSHFFCFSCIIEWSKVESKCPICKGRFKTVTKLTKSTAECSQRNTIVKIPEKDQVYQPSEEEIQGFLDPYANIVCIECHHGGDDHLMLLCDICDSPSHTYCVGLGRQVPEGNWYCNGCRSANQTPPCQTPSTPENVSSSLPLGITASTLHGRRSIHRRIRIMLFNGSDQRSPEFNDEMSGRDEGSSRRNFRGFSEGAGSVRLDLDLTGPVDR